MDHLLPFCVLHSCLPWCGSCLFILTVCDLALAYVHLLFCAWVYPLYKLIQCYMNNSVIRQKNLHLQYFLSICESFVETLQDWMKVLWGKRCALLLLFTTLSHSFLMTVFLTQKLTDLIFSRRLFSRCHLWNTGAFLKSIRCLSWAAPLTSASCKTRPTVYYW